MIWRPKPKQKVKLNYRDKNMPCQGIEGTVMFAATGPGPMNACVKWVDKMTGFEWLESVPRGNLNVRQ